MGFIEAVLASLVAAAVFGGGTYAGTSIANKKFKRKLDAAGETYAIKLGELIKAADRAHALDLAKLEVKARSIVSLRNQYRDSLTGLARLLNSDIDAIEEVLNRTEGSRITREQGDHIETRIKVLLERGRRRRSSSRSARTSRSSRSASCGDHQVQEGLEAFGQLALEVRGPDPIRHVGLRPWNAIGNPVHSHRSKPNQKQSSPPGRFQQVPHLET